MSTIQRSLKSAVVPLVFILWVTCGVVLICQYKGMLPWLDQWLELVIVLITLIPPLVVLIVFIGDIVKK